MPALITPFTRSGEVDTRAHTHNLRVLAEKGIEGFVIGGSNGEGPYLEPGERSSLVKTGRRRKAHFMVGIAAESTRVAVRQIQEAADAVADSVLVMTPTTLARGRDEAILRFYRTIADMSPLPVFIYSVPSVTSYNLPIELVWRLSRHDNVIGMKDSSGDVVRLQAIIDATPPGFLLYSGSSQALTAAMAVGCHGAITGSGNYVPALVLQTLEAARQSPEMARRLQKRLSSVSAEVDAHGIPGVKAAAKAAGLDPGYPREPLTRLSRGAETSIAKLI
ncbi:MAG TPA: dihydrodipicolinate synthase family protein [Acidimicrobiia bacterium]|nr:dihydrodipicolinate synthase family protein [Acidimicrobiia bacterium]